MIILSRASATHLILHSFIDIDKKTDNQDPRQQGNDKCGQPAFFIRLGCDRNSLLVKKLDELSIFIRGHNRFKP